MDVGNKRVTGFGIILPIFLLLTSVGFGLLVLFPGPTSIARNAFLPACKNNLKQLALAMQNYHDAHLMFPLPQGNFGDNQPPYSWRIALLPYVDEKKTFDSYHFTEVWDGPSNVELHSIWLNVFICPANPSRTSDHQPTETDYVAIIGEETIFTEGQPTKITDISDGTSNTLMFGELVNSDIHWMEPRDLDFNSISRRINASGAGISSAHEGGANVALVDGSIRFLSEETDPDVLRALMTKDGGETVGEF